jgi:urease accessory protein
MSLRAAAAALLTLAALAAGATEAAAHHPMGGTTPTTFWHGLLSGLGHPVIGLDHLAAVVAAGCIAATQRNALTLALAYVLIMLLGAALHAMGLEVPAAEVLAALAVIALGAVLVWPTAIAFPGAFALFALAGFIHGYVLGESIVGAETAPLFAYFIGLAAVQSAVVGGIVWLARKLLTPAEPAAKPAALRAAGAAAVVLGIWFLVQNMASVA